MPSGSGRRHGAHGHHDMGKVRLAVAFSRSLVSPRTDEWTHAPKFLLLSHVVARAHLTGKGQSYIRVLKEQESCGIPNEKRAPLLRPNEKCPPLCLCCSLLSRAGGGGAEPRAQRGTPAGQVGRWFLAAAWQDAGWFVSFCSLALFFSLSFGVRFCPVMVEGDAPLTALPRRGSGVISLFARPSVRETLWDSLAPSPLRKSWLT